MKKVIAGLILILFSLGFSNVDSSFFTSNQPGVFKALFIKPVEAKGRKTVHVRSYKRKSGIRVRSHHRSKSGR